MPGFQHGANRIFEETIGGIVISAILVAFIKSGLLDPTYIFLFSLLNMAGIIGITLVMPYWGTFYLMGWLFGLLILFNAGLIGGIEFVVYFGVPLTVLIIRIINSH